jgi:TonB family protein
MKTTTARMSTERVYGYLNFTLTGKSFRVPVYQSKEMMLNPEYADYLFFPFTDDTNGSETYAGGRYLDLRVPKEGDSLIVDFNLAYNPYCAYHSQYSCPIVPAENALDINVPAGVMYNEEHKSDTPKHWPEGRIKLDIMPEYPGGTKAIAALLKKNLRYPKAARKQRVEGTVYVQFTVEADGAVTNIKTIRGISRECDEAAERLIAMMKRWKPGESKGKPVASIMVQPINFRL